MTPAVRCASFLPVTPHNRSPEVPIRTAVLSVPLALLAGVALMSCRSETPRAAVADELAPGAAPPTVTVVASDFSFQAPAELPAGLTTLNLVNQGPSLHHIQLVKLEEGKTMDDFMAALKAGGPPPRWMVMVGGPNPPPHSGDTSSVTVALEPGNYAMVCFIPTPEGVPHLAMGMARPLTVTPAAGPPAAEPRADVVMRLTDYDFELSAPLTAGRHTIRVENAGPQEHEVVFAKLEPGKDPMDVAKWAEKQVGPPPATLYGGVSGMMPGSHAFVHVDLEPGDYALICFVPDTKDGKGHYHHGMIKRIKVGEATA